MTLLPAPKKSKRPAKVSHEVYQVDFVSVNCGKMVAASKRRIRFKFGYSNVEALANGLTGQECRGSEHEVIVTWSLSSGKQAIAFDGQEVFFDVGESTQSKFHHSWPDKFGHTLEVRIHAAPLSTKSNPDPDWRQYDLLIDGVSFFYLPKIYELGVFPREVASDAPYARKVEGQKKSASTDPSHFTFNNDQSMSFAAVRNENTPAALPPQHVQPEPNPEPLEVADLLSFDDLDSPSAAPTPAPVQTNVSSAQYTQNYVPGQNPFEAPTNSNTNTQLAFATTPNNIVTPTTSPGNNELYSNYHNGQNQSAMYSNYQMNISPAPVEGNYYNTSFGSYAHNQMNITPTGTHSPPPNAPLRTAPAQTAPAQTVPAPVAQPPTNSYALVPADPTQPQGVNGAMKNLVNLDDLFGNPKPITKQGIDKNRNDINAHRPLGELKASSPKKQPMKPVMNPFDVAPAHQNQGTYNAQAQGQQQNTFNKFNYQQNFQQGYGQPGFQYQQRTY